MGSDYKKHKDFLKKVFEQMKMFTYLGEQHELVKQHIELITIFNEALEKLDPAEKLIVTQRYLAKEDIKDHVIYNEMKISVGEYGRIRERSFAKIAAAIGFGEKEGGVER